MPVVIILIILLSERRSDLHCLRESLTFCISLCIFLWMRIKGFLVTKKCKLICDHI